MILMIKPIGSQLTASQSEDTILYVYKPKEQPVFPEFYQNEYHSGSMEKKSKLRARTQNSQDSGDKIKIIPVAVAQL